MQIVYIILFNPSYYLSFNLKNSLKILIHFQKHNLTLHLLNQKHFPCLYINSSLNLCIHSSPLRSGQILNYVITSQPWSIRDNEKTLYSFKASKPLFDDLSRNVTRGYISEGDIHLLTGRFWTIPIYRPSQMTLRLYVQMHLSCRDVVIFLGSSFRGIMSCFYLHFVTRFHI